MPDAGRKPTVEDETDAAATEENEDDWEDEDSEEIEDDEEGDEDEEEDEEIDHEDVHELAMQTNALLMWVVHFSILIYALSPITFSAPRSKLNAESSPV